MTSQILSKLYQFKRQDVSLEAEKLSFDGFFKVHTLSLQHRLFKGGVGDTLSRELFVRGPATCMLPYDPAADAVVLCEQFRVGALDYGQSPWLLELVAGINDEGEMPEEVARREAEEEAGLQVKDLLTICEYFPSPGGSNEWITLMCGWVNSAGAEGIFGLAGEGEDIRVHVVPRQEAFELVTAGHINNAASIIGLQWLQMNYLDLQQKWPATGSL